MKKEDIERAITEKNIILLSLQEDLLNLKHQLLEIESGFKRGDLVQNGKGEKGWLEYGTPPDIWHWHKMKNDGTPTKNKTFIGITLLDGFTKIE